MAADAVTLLHEVRELYKNRADKLYERHYDYITEWVTEKFGRGRSRHLQGMSLASPHLTYSAQLHSSTLGVILYIVRNLGPNYLPRVSN